MSRRNRERRKQNLLRKEMGVNVPVDYPKLAEAVHRTVCSYTGTDGCGDCMTYAIVACAWLNRITRIPHALAGGHFVSSVKGVGEIHYDHFWIMRGGVGNWTYLDFATRHNSTLIRKGFAKARPGEVLAPDAIDPGLDVPYYVGDGEGQPWKYLIITEDTLHAQAEYSQSDKLEAIERVNRYLR
jgi:hypothetical protein